jgi:invasion protein IalB
MKLKSVILAASALMMIAAPLAARADDAKPAAAATPATAAPAVAAPATAAPAVASKPADPELVQKWAKFCGPAPDGHSICLVRKIVLTDGHIAGTLTLQLDTAKGAPPVVGIAAAPVGVLLLPGLQWQVDSGKPTVSPFNRCTPQTCESMRVVEPALIAAMRKGKQLTLTTKGADGKNLAIAFPLSGFGAAFDMKNAPTYADYQKSLTPQ